MHWRAGAAWSNTHVRNYLAHISVIFSIRIEYHSIFSLPQMKGICNICLIIPSEGENELLPQRGQSFQRVLLGKRKSLWAFSRKNALVSSLTRSSICPHRRWVDLSINIKTLKITSIKKRSWSSKIMLLSSAVSISIRPINTCHMR